jgi:hypothetical protein
MARHFVPALDRDLPALTERPSWFEAHAASQAAAPARRTARRTTLRLRIATRVAAWTVVVSAMLGPLMGGPAAVVQAGFEDGGSGAQVLIGPDDDNLNNPLIQPAGVAANQSLNNTDIQHGGSGNDVLIGLLGNDVQLGDSGDDILVGGTEQGQAPNSDVQYGDSGSDISIWAPGDGSDFFMGGSGRDAQIVGVLDRNQQNVPTLGGQAPGFPQGIPTANVSGSPGFCRLERLSSADLGYEFLVRFVGRANGNVAVTLRLVDVEQVFCTSEAGGAIVYADLTSTNPQFVEVSLDQVAWLNPLAARIMR